MEVPKEDEHRLDEIKTKINNAKERLRQLNSKTTNLDLMEALIDSWLDSTESQVPLPPVQLSADPPNSVNEPVQLLNRISPSLTNPKYQLHSVCKENDDFTSAGLLPSRYEGFCQAAKLRFMNEHYISDGKPMKLL